MIVGAGLAGCIAAHIWPRMPVSEAWPAPTTSHKALLRFRSDAIGKLVGIDFKAVTVNKGIFWRGAFHGPTIALANLYSRKVIGGVYRRSIWNLDPVQRWVAPENLHELLLDRIHNRVAWDSPWDYASGDGVVISTAPLPTVLDSLGIHCSEEFTHAPIEVRRFRMPDCDVYQTIYFPSEEHNLYRASITKDLLICEFAGEEAGSWPAELSAAFGIPLSEMQPVERVSQRYGKIAPINDRLRKTLLSRLTADHGIYSFGRFATWRNILLDDLENDARVIKKLMVSSYYDKSLIASQ